MQEYEAYILKTEFRGDNKYLINLSCKDIASEIVPGQFVQVRAGKGTDPFLRRTFSVCSADAERGIIQLLIDIVGRGTELLCCMKRGGTMNIIGSLGTGYDIHLGGDGPFVHLSGERPGGRGLGRELTGAGSG